MKNRKKSVCLWMILLFLLAGIPVSLLAQASASARTAENKAVLFFGLYTQWYKFEAALPGYKINLLAQNSVGFGVNHCI